MLKNLQLENFRSYKKFKLELGHTTILIGRNGVGKTNILESIVLLSFCRSFRDEDKRNLINFEADFARIVGDNLEMFFGRYPRLIIKAKENGVSRKMSEFIGLLPSVVLSPETMLIISGAPAERRRFLDIMISQIDKEYLKNLIEYNKVRKQRNNLLQRIAKRYSDPSELDFWDKELMRGGESIIQKRKKVLDFFNLEISKIYQDISGKPDSLIEIEYQSNFVGDLPAKLSQIREREITSGTTLLGPHRDDFTVNLNGRDMHNFASRGEVKSAILALKMCELNFMKSEREDHPLGVKFEPIILLDDVFSEFDPDRRSHLAQFILKHQSLVTSTERAHLPKELRDKAEIIELK